MVTCSPWQPTRAKKADRNALRSGPLPSAIILANSLTSRPRKPRPSRPVTTRPTCVHSMLRTPAAIIASPQTKLDSSRNAVSAATVFRLKSCSGPGPPAVECDSTA